MRLSLTYLICATPRTGSYLLCEALYNTGLAGRPTEYFAAQQEKSYLELWNLSEQDYPLYLQKITRVSATPNGVFGAKIIWTFFEEFISKLRQIPGYGEMETHELLPTIFPNLHYIWITRRDKLRQAISWWKAIQKGSWLNVGGRELPASETSASREPEFSLEAIDALLQRIDQDEESVKRFFKACGVEPFTVIYEDFVTAYEETTLCILEYLKIPVSEKIVFRERNMQPQSDTLTEEWPQRYRMLKQTPLSLDAFYSGG